jgi:hypothetical protein
MVARSHGRKTSAVAQIHHENPVQVDKLVFRQRIKRRLPALHLALKICFRTIALAVADTRLIHAHGGVSRLVDQAPQKNTEAVAGIGVGILHAVAAEPSDEKNQWHLTCDAIGTSHKGPEFLLSMVGNQS